MLFRANFGGSRLILNIFAHIIAEEEEHLVDGEIMIRLRRIRNSLSLLTVIVLLSIAAPWGWFFLGIHVRLLVWYVPIISFWLNRLRSSPFGLPRVPRNR